MTGWSNSRRRLILVVVVLAPLLMAHHPSFPTALDFEPLEESVDDWAAVMTPGFVSSTEPSEYVCKEAFGVEGQLYGEVLDHHHYAMVVDEGLGVTLEGCNLDEVHEVDGNIVDLDSRGTDRLAAVATREDADGIYVSLDGGRSLEATIEAPEGREVTTVEWVDDQRVVAGAFEEGDDVGQGRLLEIDVEGETVDDHLFETGLRYPFVLGADGDRVVAAARTADFESAPTLAWGPVDTPDDHRAAVDAWPIDADVGAERVFAVPVVDDWDRDWSGMVIGNSDGELVEDQRLEDHDSRCVVGDTDGHWICSSGLAEDWEVWRVDEDQQEPEPFYQLAQLEGPRSDCPAGSDVAEVCGEHWETLAPRIPGGSYEPDDDDGSSDVDFGGPVVGAPDAGAAGGDDVDGESGAADSAACQSTGDGSVPVVALLAGLLLVAARGWRSSRRAGAAIGVVAGDGPQRGVAMTERRDAS